MHRRALQVLTCRAPGPRQPPQPAPPSSLPPGWLCSGVQGRREGGRKLLGAGTWLSPALPPLWASPGLSVCLVLGRSGLVCSHSPGSLQSTSLCLCNALSGGHQEKRSSGPLPPASPPPLSPSSQRGGCILGPGEGTAGVWRVVSFLPSPPLPEVGSGGQVRARVAVGSEGARGEGILLGINE